MYNKVQNSAYRPTAFSFNYKLLITKSSPGAIVICNHQPVIKKYEEENQRYLEIPHL